MSERSDFEETNRVLELLRAQLEEKGDDTSVELPEVPSEEMPEAIAEPTEALAEETPEEPTGESVEISDESTLEAEEETPDVLPEEPADPPVTEEAIPSTDKKRRSRKKSKRLSAARRAALMSEAEEPVEAPDAHLDERRAAFAADLAEDSDWKAHEPEEKASGPAESTAPETTIEPAPDEKVTAAESSASQQDPAPEADQKDKKEPPVFVSEQSANVMVEDLLSDIFGHDESKRSSWFRQDEVAPAKPKEEPIEKKPETTPKPRRQIERPITRDPAQLRLELDGMTVRLPEEEEIRGPEKPQKKRENVPAGEDGGLFAAVSVERPGREGAVQKPTLARASAEQMAFKRSVEASEEDFKLLLDLDYETELGETIGFEKIKEYREKAINGGGNESLRRGRDRRDDEYVSHAQDINFYKFYAKQRHHRLIRLIIAAVLLFVFFIYESPAFAALWMRGAGGRYPLSYLTVGLIFLLTDVVLLRRNLIDGVVQMFRLTPSDHSFCSVVVLITLFYHAALFFIHPEGTTIIFFSPAAGHLLLLALSDLFDSHRESAAFRVVSSRQQKYALVPDASVGGRQNDAKEQLMTDTADETEWYIRPVGFVRNYFANTAKKTAHNSSFGAQLILTVAAALAFGLYAFAAGGTVRDMGHVMFVTFLLAVPGIAVFITSLPMFFASVFRLGRKGAIIGERPVFECEGKHVLILPDSDVFVRLQHEQFELVKNCDVSKTLILIRALLDKIESPMAESVNVERASRLPADTVTLTDISQNGVSAVVTGERKTGIVMGSPDYLRDRCGIQVALKADMDQEDLRRRLLCVAVGNHIVALFLTRYRLDPDMESLLSALSAEDVRLMVRSKDPVVTDTLLRHLCPDEQRPVDAVKPTAKEMDIRTDRADVTVVAVGSGREAARTFTVCRRVRRAARFGKLLQTVSLALGIGLGALFAFLGRTVHMPAYAVTLYLIAWSLVEGLVAFLFLHGRDRD